MNSASRDSYGCTCCKAVMVTDVKRVWVGPKPGSCYISSLVRVRVRIEARTAHRSKGASFQNRQCATYWRHAVPVAPGRSTTSCRLGTAVFHRHILIHVCLTTHAQVAQPVGGREAICPVVVGVGAPPDHACRALRPWVPPLRASTHDLGLVTPQRLHRPLHPSERLECTAEWSGRSHLPLCPWRRFAWKLLGEVVFGGNVGTPASTYGSWALGALHRREALHSSCTSATA